MGKNFRQTLNDQLKDPEFKKEWDNLDTQFQIIKAILDAREQQHITQKQLSEMTGIAQGDISKIENGNANPSIKTLIRIANALGKEIRLSFEPIKEKVSI